MERHTAVIAMCLLVVAGMCGGQEPPATPASQADAAKLVVYKSVEAVDLAKPIAFSGGLEGAKLAFQTKGAADAGFTLHDSAANKDLRPARGLWKLTGNCPYVPRCRWAGGEWAPCVYRLDLFGQDAMLWRKLKKPVEGAEFELRFANKPSFAVRNLVVYRGGDTQPPDPPDGLAARADDAGMHLSWKPAADNVNVAWYVVSRTDGEAKFVKIVRARK